METTKEIDIHSYLAERKQIADIWGIEDVQSIRPDLNPERAWEVLVLVKDNHDCNYGITWETIKITANDLFGNQPKEDDQCK